MTFTHTHTHTHTLMQGSESGLSSAQRAFHPKEVTKEQLKIDIQYYLQSQVQKVTVVIIQYIVGLYYCWYGSNDTSRILLPLPPLIKVHAVVSRLCEPIAGLDSVQLADWLGLDPSLYAKHRLQTGETEESGYSSMPGGVSISNAEPLKVKCPRKECQCVTEIKVSLISTPEKKKNMYNVNRSRKFSLGLILGFTKLTSKRSNFQLTCTAISTVPT